MQGEQGTHPESRRTRAARAERQCSGRGGGGHMAKATHSPEAGVKLSFGT